MNNMKLEKKKFIATPASSIDPTEKFLFNLVRAYTIMIDSSAPRKAENV